MSHISIMLAYDAPIYKECNIIASLLDYVWFLRQNNQSSINDNKYHKNKNKNKNNDNENNNNSDDNDNDDDCEDDNNDRPALTVEA